MKIRNEAEMEEQIQGAEDHHCPGCACHRVTRGSRCRTVAEAAQGRLARGQATAHPGKQSWENGWEGFAMGRGWRSWGLQRAL